MKFLNYFARIRKFYTKRILVAITVIAMIFIVIPSMTAGAAWEADGVGGIVTVPGSAGLTSYFYRLPAGIDNNDDEYAYGYGYSYINGTYSYGYGYGYGYAYFSGYAENWSNGDARLGFFMGTSGGAPSTVTFTAVNGVATNPISVTVAPSSGDIIAKIPAGTISGTGYTGAVTTAASSTYADIPSAIRAGFSSGSTVAMMTFTFAGATGDVTFGDELLIRMAYPSFPSDGTGLVKIVNSGGEGYTISSTCSALGYLGSVTSDSDLLNVANYSLTPGTTSTSHCYTPYNNYLYIATRHASTFVAGVVASSGSSSPSGGVLLGGNSGGSGGDDDEEDTEDDTEDDTADDTEDDTAEGEQLKIEDFADLVGIASDDWRYKVAEMILETGLFVGETGADGKRYFNMEGEMNRAMAATVVARYIGCDTETSPLTDPFPDVDKGAWYAPSVECLKALGVVSGKTHVDPPIFDSGSAVTRAEFLKMMVEGNIENVPALEAAWRLIMSSPATEFEDVSAEDWYSGYINLANEYKLLEGYLVDGKRYAKGSKTIIRIEAAAIVTNFLE